MNYFELFGIAPAFVVDVAALKPRFFALQRQYHPDYAAGEGDAETDEKMQMSAAVNAAWKTFADADALMQYLLQLTGTLQPNEKYNLPPDFLMAMMNLNEQKMEGVPAAEIAAQVADMQRDIYAPVAKIIADYGQAPPDAEALNLVKRYYFQKKYLDRLTQQ
jgi:molecular chaperone HscB